MTLAAWNDSEYATGSFTSSIFDTESSTNGTYASNTSAPGAAFVFSPSAGGMSPGVSSYGSLNIRTTTATNVAGNVVLSSVTNNGGALLAALEYRVVLVPVGTTCDINAFSTGTYIVGGTSTYVAPTTIGSPTSKPIGAGGTLEQRYCFDVRVQNGAANTFQGKTATVTWLFTATSV